MPGTGQQLIQTLLSLRELQLRQQAADLATKEFGLRVQSEQRQGEYQKGELAMQERGLGIQQGQLDVAKGQGATDFLRTLTNTEQGMAHPEALTPFASQFAPRLGLDVPATQALMGGIAPSQTAATSGAIGAQSHLEQFLNEAALKRLQGLPPDQQQPIVQGFLQRVATNQSLSDAAIDATVNSLTEDEKKQALLVGKRLAPNAAEDAQIRMGWANQRLEDRKLEVQASAMGLEHELGLLKLKDTAGENVYKEAAQALHEYRTLYEGMVRSSATLTPEGRAMGIRQLNAFAAQLQKLAPEVYGKEGTSPLPMIPPGTELAPTGFIDFVRTHMTY